MNVTPTSISLRSSLPVGCHRKPPVLKVTLYERISSLLVVILFALLVSAITLLVMWMSTWQPEPPWQAEITMIPPAGMEDGKPEEDFPDLNIPADKVLTNQSLNSVIKDAPVAAELATQELKQNDQESGSIQSGPGNDKPPGIDDGPPENPTLQERWFIHFSAEDSLEEYARQLDYFGIELGVLLIGDDSMTILSDLSNPSPSRRKVTAASMDKDTIHFHWRGGARQQADLKLFEKAGVEHARSGVIFHFYPVETQQKLLDAERAYRNRSSDEIRRTYFRVQKSGNGYVFQVTRQTWY